MKRPEIGVLTHLLPDASNIRTVAEFGLPCAQVCSWDKDLCNLDLARKVKKTAAECGVRLTAFWGGYSGPAAWNFTRGPVTLGIVPVTYRQMRIDQLCRWADFAAEAGAPALITHCGFLPENLTDPEFEAVAVAIDEIGRYCKKLGIVILRFIEEVGLDNLGINLDPANLLMYGKGNPIDALHVFGKYVRAIHAKDGMPPTNGRELGPEVKVGTGFVRYPQFLPALLDCGFEGDLTIEREISGEQQNKDIRDTIAYLDGLLDAYFKA